MPIESAVNFVEALRQSRVLTPEQQNEVARLQAATPDPRLLARELIQRGWLTPYQVNQIFQGKGGELVLGQYVILERLGEGGMGLVFKGKHRRMDRSVAIKVIRKEHVAHPDALKRFQREMQAVASLSHANIVMAYDGDQVGDTHFFAMELVEGNDLGSLIKKHGAPPVPVACDYLRQAALGLQHAHEKGMVHRDIKPSNFLVTRPEPSSGSPWGQTIKLLDMGVARLHEPPGGLDSISALTKEGRVVGTPDYMAPEQAANSAKADIRSDIYSLGCTFYCMLAGQLPYPGGTPMEKLLKHRVDQATPVEKIRPEVPPGIAGLVRRLMAKKPEDRFQTPADVVAALDAILTGSDTVALGPAPGVAEDLPPTAVMSGRMAVPRRRNLLLIAGLLLGAAVFGFAVVGIAYLAFGSRKGTTTRTVDNRDSGLRDLTARVANPKEDPEVLRRDVLRYRLDHAGTSLALDAGKLLAKLPSPLDELRASNVPPAERAPMLLSGDRPIPFPSEVVAVLGQRRQRHWGAVRSTAVSPDGRLVASGGNDNVIRLWDANTMQELAVLRGHSSNVYWVGFTGDGKTLISAGSDYTIRFWQGFPANAREVAPWQVRLAGLTPVTLSANGLTLAFGAPYLSGPEPQGIQVLDLSSLAQPGGKPQPRPQPPARFARRPQTLALSADGKTLAASGESPPGIYIYDLTANPPRNIHQLKDANPRALAFSPAGNDLASGDQDGTIRIYSDLNKPAVPMPRVLRDGGVNVLGLAFQPSGKRLISLSTDRTMRRWDLSMPAGKEVPIRRQMSSQITCMALSGAGPNLMLISGGQDNLVRKWNIGGAFLMEAPPFLPDGLGSSMAVAFVAGDRDVANSHVGSASISLWEPAANKQPTISGTSGSAFFLAASADGRALAACGRMDGRVQIRRLSDSGAFNADDLPPLPRPVTCLALSPDGKTIAAGNVDGLIQVASVTGPKPWKWRALAGHRSSLRDLAFSPDGKFLASAAEDVRVWGLENDKPVIGPIAGVNAVVVAFAPDGKALAVGGAQSGTGQIWVWNLVGSQAKPRAITWKRGHSQAVSGIAFTPDGERLVSAGMDGQVILHSLASGDARAHVQLAGPIHRLALSTCGRYAATANGNGTVYVIRLTDRPAR